MWNGVAATVAYFAKIADDPDACAFVIGSRSLKVRMAAPGVSHQRATHRAYRLRAHLRRPRCSRLACALPNRN